MDFEVFNNDDCENFIIKHQSFIDENVDLFDESLYTTRERNYVIAKFIKSIYGEIPDGYLPYDIFEKFSKSLNILRNYVKRKKREQAFKKFKSELYVGKMFMNVREKNKSYGISYRRNNILILVESESKKYVKFKSAKYVNYHPNKYKIKFNNDEIVWDTERRVKKEDFVNYDFGKEISEINEIKDKYFNHQ